MKTFHIVLKKEFQNEESMRKVIAAGKLVEVNENRAQFFNYCVITGNADDSMRSVIASLPEVSSIREDGEKAI